MAVFRRRKNFASFTPPTLPNREPVSTTAHQRHTTDDDPEIPTLELQTSRSRRVSTSAAPDITPCDHVRPIHPATSEPPQSEINGVHKHSANENRGINTFKVTPPNRSSEDKPTVTPVVQSATEQPIAMFLRATDLVEITLRPVSEKDLKNTPDAKGSVSRERMSEKPHHSRPSGAALQNDGSDFEPTTPKTNGVIKKTPHVVDSAVSQGIDRKLREFSGETLYEPYPSPPALSELSSIDDKTAQSVSERIDTGKKVGVEHLFSISNLPDARNPFNPGHDHDHRQGQDTDLPARSRKSYDDNDEKSFTVRGSLQRLQETTVDVSITSHASDSPTNITKSMSHDGESAHDDKSGAWISSSGSSSPNMSYTIQTSKPSCKDGIPASQAVKPRVAIRNDMNAERSAASFLDSAKPNLTNENPFSQLHMMSGASMSAPTQSGTSSTAGVDSRSSHHDSTEGLEQSEPETENNSNGVEQRYDTFFSTPMPTIGNTRAALAKLAEESVRSLELQNVICKDPDLELPWKIMMHKAQQRETVRRLLEESERLRSISEPSFGHRNQLSQSPTLEMLRPHVVKQPKPTGQFAPTTTRLDDPFVSSSGGEAQKYVAEVGPSTPPSLPKHPRSFDALQSYQARSSSSGSCTGFSEGVGSPFLVRKGRVSRGKRHTHMESPSQVRHDSARHVVERKTCYSNRIELSPTFSRSRLHNPGAEGPLSHRMENTRLTSADGTLHDGVSDVRAPSYTVRRPASRRRKGAPLVFERTPELQPCDRNDSVAPSDRSSLIGEGDVPFHSKPWSLTKKPVFDGTVPNPPVPPSTHFGRRCVTSPATSSSPLLQGEALRSYGSIHSPLDEAYLLRPASPRTSDLIADGNDPEPGEVDPSVEIIAGACTEMATINRTLGRAVKTISQMEGAEERNEKGRTKAARVYAAGSITGGDGRIEHSYGSKAGSMGRKWTVSIAPGRVRSLRRRFEGMHFELRPRDA
ncbi:hypothetical protein FB567DRAFT_546884 [Paraphoma chrysanthemicola]|uniref:Uncharacterized protein n=1 Tax=Paraphoma chrysanthemicola TaxID=798071 RepID=A0A8K0RD90_9PLEO|nr:hypothetical protein FB567DRAFT_546884 [Paraphoma chrysanthemicola]